MEAAHVAIKENKGEIQTSMEDLSVAILNAGELVQEFEEEILVILKSGQATTAANHQQEIKIGEKTITVKAEYDGEEVLSPDIRLVVKEGSDLKKEAQKAEGAANKDVIMNLNVILIM
ncbi:hypothetical protein [Eubacterium aggregans]|uniref:hypothetical protein n=1 Tax=Eubacterium aggregans TaxID=81409 RepID=UPI003F35DB85